MRWLQAAAAMMAWQCGMLLAGPGPLPPLAVAQIAGVGEAWLYGSATNATNGFITQGSSVHSNHWRNCHPWHAMDGGPIFNTSGLPCNQWRARCCSCSGQFLNFDFGVALPFNGIGVWGAADRTHDPRSFNLLTGNSPGGPWTLAFSSGNNALAAQVDSLQTVGGFCNTSRYWRFQLRNCYDSWEPWIKEIAWRMNLAGCDGSPPVASPTVAPTPPPFAAPTTVPSSAPTAPPTPPPTTPSPTTSGAPTSAEPTTGTPSTAAPATAAPATASPSSEPTAAPTRAPASFAPSGAPQGPGKTGSPGGPAATGGGGGGGGGGGRCRIASSR